MANKIVLYLIKKTAENFEIQIKDYKEFLDIRLKDKKGRHYFFPINKFKL